MLHGRRRGRGGPGEGEREGVGVWRAGLAICGFGSWFMGSVGVVENAVKAGKAARKTMMGEEASEGVGDGLSHGEDGRCMGQEHGGRHFWASGPKRAWK